MTNQRKLQWWAVLQCRRRPSDLPEGYTLARLERELAPSERRKFWNGDFKAGLNLEKYIKP